MNTMKPVIKIAKMMSNVILVNSAVLCLLFSAVLYIYSVNNQIKDNTVSGDFRVALTVASQGSSEEFNKLDLDNLTANEKLAIETVYQQHNQDSIVSHVKDKCKSLYEKAKAYVINL
jgi:hypothetical protein